MVLQYGSYPGIDSYTTVQWQHTNVHKYTVLLPLYSIVFCVRRYSGTHTGPHLCPFVNVNNTIVFCGVLWQDNQGQMRTEGAGGFIIISIYSGNPIVTQKVKIQVKLLNLKENTSITLAPRRGMRTTRNQGACVVIQRKASHRDQQGN